MNNIDKHPKPKHVQKKREREKEREREREREREKERETNIDFLLRRAGVWYKAYSVISAEESASDSEERITNSGCELENLLCFGGICYGYFTYGVRHTQGDKKDEGKEREKMHQGDMKVRVGERERERERERE